MQYVAGVFLMITLLTVCACTSSWFSVARIHTAIWTVIYWGYCICADGNELKGYGTLWLIVSCFCILIGEKLGERGNIRKDCGRDCSLSSPLTTSENRGQFWMVVIVCLTLLSIVGNILEVYAYGFSLADLTSFDRILKMSNEIATMRYNGFETSSVITLLQTQKYTACLVSGYFFLSCKKFSKRIICCLPFLSVILNVIIENTKAPVIASAILFCIGLIIGYVCINLRYPKLTAKRACRFVLAAVVLIALLVFAMVIRLGEINSKTLGVVATKFVVYAFGNVQAFDLWLSNLYSYDGFGLGINTFMAPFNLLGIVTRRQGVYDFIDGAASNVFSGYRGVIEDFGLVGGLIFVMLIGYIGGRCIKRMATSPAAIMPKIGYSFTIFFIVFSLFVSPYVYTSFCLMIIEFAFLLYIEKHKCLNR